MATKEPLSKVFDACLDAIKASQMNVVRLTTPLK